MDNHNERLKRIGYRVSNLIADKGYTVGGFAYIKGINDATLRSVTEGNDCRVSTLMLIADALEVDITALFDAS